MKKALVRLAKVRTDVVKLDNGADGTVDVLVREVGSDEFAHYGTMQKPVKKGGLGKSRVEALAYLLSVCIVEETEAGLVSVYTESEAMDIARSARVAMKITNAIMELSGFGDDEEDEETGEPDASRADGPPAGGAAG